MQCGRPGFNPGIGKIPWRRERLPTPVFWPGECRGLQSMGSQRDTTERLIICKDSIEHLLLFSHFKEKETQVHWPEVTQLILN